MLGGCFDEELHAIHYSTETTAFLRISLIKEFNNKMLGKFSIFKSRAGRKSVKRIYLLGSFAKFAKLPSKYILFTRIPLVI